GSATPATVNTVDTYAVELGVKFQTATAGTVSGIRFYKGSQDTGTHTGEIWSSSGQQLATTTFTNETTDGWQTAIFSNPVALTPGTTYVASYHTDVGHYSSSVGYFASATASGPLTAPSSDASGGNGVFAYGSGNLFPDQTYQSTNFWVDVLFNPANGTANQPPTAVNDTGPTVTLNTATVIQAATLLANDTDPNGDALTVTGVSAPVNGTVALNAQTNTITFTPTTGYTGPAGFTYAIADGRGGTASASVGLTVAAAGTGPVSLFSATATPATVNTADSSPVELGVKFQASSAGTVSAIRFYKGSQDTGTHTGEIWSSTGQQLATATFTNESASGWQTATFSSPVTLTPGATYVASYHTNAGYYSSSSSYFTSATTSGPLTAPSSDASGGNGVYAYGSSTLFPTSSYQATNYWVDVQFNPASGTDQPPVAVNDTGPTVTLNTATVIQAATLLANDTDPDGDALTVTGVSAPVNGTVALNAQTNTITFTPTTGYTGPAGFTYAIADGRGGTASASVGLTVAAAGTGPVSLFSATATPATVNTADSSPVELGVKFQSSSAGTVSAIRFYKGSQDTGTHTGEIWSSTGQQLATATFTNESASGWQTATFSSPVTLTPGATYVASYHTNAGYYSSSSSYFTSATTSGPLTAPSSDASGGNGVYAYGSSTLFPTSSYQATNYWVDVQFNPASGTDQPPVAVNDTGPTVTLNTATVIQAATLLANDTDPDGDALTVTGVSAPTNGTVALNAQANTITFTPTTGYTGPASFTYAVADGRGGTASASVSFKVAEASTGPVSLFSATATPATVNTADSSPVELGVKFQSSSAGTVSAIRFYKGSQDTGTHTGEIWSSTGQQLATATFTNESASGWQTATFSNPVTLTPGTTYVASYHTDAGHYSSDSNYFADAVTSGSLTAPASDASGGNGVYAYGGSSLFPANSFQRTNYWVDVVFNPQASA
ncbi:DUF4082 domain-containing protein, partial [Methylobacterium crusticola]|uniref:DUF4082 domain-containing protein n=1 Tax=Methylobacterium crusticola TaxID=1697972 RepID=UPI000FFC38F5